MTIKGAQGPSRAGLLLTLGVLAWAGAAQAQSLDEIIEAAVAATGGRDAIAQIETVRHTGSFTMGTDFGPIEGSLEIVIIPNQKMYQALISDLFSQRSAWAGPAAGQTRRTCVTRLLWMGFKHTRTPYFLMRSTPRPTTSRWTVEIISCWRSR